MEFIAYITYILKRIRAKYRGWKVSREIFDPYIVQRVELKEKMDRVADDLIPNEVKNEDKTTYPYYLKKESHFGRIKIEYYRTHEEAEEVMCENLKNKVCAWIIKQ